MVKQRSEFKVLIAYPNLTMMLVPSLAIGLFTTIFKREGYQVDLFDATHYVDDDGDEVSSDNRQKYLQYRKYDENDDLGIRAKIGLLKDFRKKVEEYEPDLIIFSVVEDVWRQTKKMLETIEDLDIPHLLGGVFPTAAPEVVINDPVVKMIGLGEGEKIIVDVADAIRNKKSYEDIDGIWYKGENGVVNRNERGPVVNINDTVADYSLFDENRFLRPMGGRVFKTVPIETYRGCPFSCTYCNSPMQTKLSRAEGLGNFLRKKTLERTRAELRELKEKFNPEFFYFIDDSFTARPKKDVFDFCNMYEEFKIPFWFNTRPETCTPEMLRRLKEVGAYRISFGIESGNEQYRKQVLKRNGSNEAIRGYFKMINDAGIAFSCNLIIGFPGESRGLVMDTVEFMKTLRGFDALTVSIFTPYHGTELREVAIKNNWLDESYITKHTMASSALTMSEPFLTAKEIDGLVRALPLYIYFPKSEWREIRKTEEMTEEGEKVFKHYSSIYRKNFLKENQDDEKIYIDGATGCKSNPKDSYQLVYKSSARMTKDEIDKLIV